MSRLMSVSLTEHAVINRSKTVTRRLGWWENRNGRRIIHTGDHLTLCRKVMGRKPGDPLVRLAEVEIVDIRREPLSAITPDEITREGVHCRLSPDEWVAWFCEEMGCRPSTRVTRIEWRYIDDGDTR